MLMSLIRRVLGGARAKRGAAAGRAAAADFERARALQHSGDHAQARALCEGILSRDPGHAGAHCLLGALHGQQGNLERASVHLTEATRLAPQLQDAHLGLGNVHRLRKDPEAAARSYRRALAIQDEAPEIHFSLALALREAGRPQQAVEHFERASSLSPGHPDAAREAALCHAQLGTYDRGIVLLERALREAPCAGDLHAALGFLQQKMHRPGAALEWYEKARALGHADAELYNNLGIVCQDLGRIPEALAHYDRAIELQPDFPLARFHRALARLLTGDYANGWPDYELRLISEDNPRPPGPYARWDGSALAGRTILVYGEQGLGDEIMFASCLPQIVDMAGRCVIECSAKLEPLFRRSFPRARVCAAAAARSVPDSIKAEPIECEAPSGSLPLYLRRSIAEFPRHQGYLKADPQRIAVWRERLCALGPGLKIGVSWQGGTHKTRSPLRSIPLARWLPIFGAAPAHFVSLQYGGVRAELDRLNAEHGVRVTHWQEAIDDYDQTAALACALDLVISVQTAIVHLAGALGRPVWVMAPYSPEWRYGFTGARMPWYPSVRLFRQPSFGEWSPTIAEVAGEVAALGVCRT
jgi:tetratricopeptide (TPR) repeat protein